MILKPRLFRKPNLSHPLAKGLVGCWLMNEGGGGKGYDLSGSGYHGTLEADTHFVAGKFGSALSFDGTGDYFSFANKLYLGEFTISVWFNPAKMTTMICGANDAYHQYIAFNTTTNIRVDIGVSKNFTVPTITLNKWHHLVITRDGSGDIRVYLNSVESTTGAQNDGTTLEVTDFGNAYPTESYFYEGLFDHAMIYNYALSASEITKLYIDPFAMFEQDPIELWTAAMAGEEKIEIEKDWFNLSNRPEKELYPILG